MSNYVLHCDTNECSDFFLDRPTGVCYCVATEESRDEMSPIDPDRPKVESFGEKPRRLSPTWVEVADLLEVVLAVIELDRGAARSSKIAALRGAIEAARGEA